MHQKPQPFQPQLTPKKTFTGNSFTIDFIDGWQDKTVSTLTGPVTDGIQHNIIINIDHEVRFNTVLEFTE